MHSRSLVARLSWRKFCFCAKWVAVPCLIVTAAPPKKYYTITRNTPGRKLCTGMVLSVLHNTLLSGGGRQGSKKATKKQILVRCFVPNPKCSMYVFVPSTTSTFIFVWNGAFGSHSTCVVLRGHVKEELRHRSVLWSHKPPIGAQPLQVYGVWGDPPWNPVLLLSGSQQPA